MPVQNISNLHSQIFEPLVRVPKDKGDSIQDFGAYFGTYCTPLKSHADISNDT